MPKSTPTRVSRQPANASDDTDQQSLAEHAASALAQLDPMMSNIVVSKPEFDLGSSLLIMAAAEREDTSMHVQAPRKRRVATKADLTGHTWSFDVSKKGNPLLFINSFHFCMVKGVYGPGFGVERLLPGNCYYWICVTKNCKVRANTRGRELYNLTSHEHLHDTQVNESANRRAEALVYTEAKRSQEEPEALLERLKVENENAFAGLPITQEHLLGIIKKARYRRPLKISQNELTSLQIPEVYRSTLRGEAFLQYISPPEDGENRFGVFSTQRNFEYLATSGRWFIDGSFSAYPEPFQAVLIVSADVKNSILPLVYFLLPNKLEATYAACFSFLLNKLGCPQPTSIIMDFEPIIHNVLLKVFPSSIFQGCFFHFCQAIYRRIHKDPAIRHFNNLPNTSLEIRKLLALAYVPPPSVQDCFSILIREPFYIENQVILTPLLEYMARTWVGFHSDAGWISPRIQLSWNCFYDVIQKAPNTKETVESLHSGLNEAYHSRGFNVVSFCDHIRARQGVVDSQLDLAQNGTIFAPRELSAATNRREDDLYSICTSYSEGADKAAYLEELAKVLMFGGFQINTTYDPTSDAAFH